jgi:hypothetical protein
MHFSAVALSMEPPKSRAPLPRIRYYLHGGDVLRLLGGRYPSVTALTGSCAGPVISPLLRP